MKCHKVKNACKICFEKVSIKNGLQCQGACKKWAHFKCLNYTPGKIQDIKKGIIKVTCPCPDCVTESPKEFLTNPPFACTNQKCPANVLPKCESLECPSNKPSVQSAAPQLASPKCPGPLPCANPRPKSSPVKTKPKHPPTPPTPPTPRRKSPSSSVSDCNGPCSSLNTSSSEDITPVPDNKQLLNTLANMCNTVGQLSNQLKELMCKIEK